MASFLSNLSLGKFFAFFAAAPRSVVGIDIGSSAVKVVQLRKKKGRAVLETYGELALGPYVGLAVGQSATLSTEKTAEALKDIFREAGVTAKTAALALPLRSSLLKVIELPAFKEEQINRMVPIEARRHVPVPISEVTLDWWVIPRREFQSPADEASPAPTAPAGQVPAGRTEVLLVAVHKAAVTKQQDIAKALALDARTFEIETFSTIRSVLARDIAATAMLDIGAGTSKLTIVDYGIVRVSHVINRGAQDISVAMAAATGVSFAEAEKIKRKDGLSASGASSTLDYILYEAAGVIEEYQKRYARLVNKVVCTGGGAVMPGFLQLAERQFQAEVVLGNPFAKTETPAFMAEILNQAGPEFAVALGLAIHELEGV